MQAYTAGDYTAVPNGVSGGQMFGYPDTARSPAAGGGATSPKAKLSAKKRAAAAAGSAAPAAPQATGSASGGSGSSSNSSGGSGKTPVKAPKASSAGAAASKPAQAVSSAASAVTSAAAPVVKAIGYAAALTVCNQQIAAIPPVLGLSVPGNAGSVCASKEQNATSTSAAAAAIPNTLPGLLSWL